MLFVAALCYLSMYCVTCRLMFSWNNEALTLSSHALFILSDQTYTQTNIRVVHLEGATVCNDKFLTPSSHALFIFFRLQKRGNFFSLHLAGAVVDILLTHTIWSLTASKATASALQSQLCCDLQCTCLPFQGICSHRVAVTSSCIERSPHQTFAFLSKYCEQADSIAIALCACCIISTLKSCSCHRDITSTTRSIVFFIAPGISTTVNRARLTI